MSQEKTSAESVKVSIASSTAPTASLSNDVEMVQVVLAAGLMFLIRDGWDKFMEWMRQDEFFSGMEEVAMKTIFVRSLQSLERELNGTSGKETEKPATGRVP